MEFHPGSRVTFVDLAGMEIELSEALGGRMVDLRTVGDLFSHYFRDQVARSEEVQYVAG